MKSQQKKKENKESAMQAAKEKKIVTHPTQTYKHNHVTITLLFWG